MQPGRTTLSKFLIQQLKGTPEQNDLAALLVDMAACVKAISAMTARGALGGMAGHPATAPAPGQTPKQLERLSGEVFCHALSAGGLVAGIATEQRDEPLAIDPQDGSGRFLAVVDPLDGASGIDVNGAVGSIFSVLRAPDDPPAALSDYLRPGRRQLAAGYAIYGPATMLVLTVGKGTHGFTLDREVGNFILTHPQMQVPPDSSEFAIDASNERFWEAPVQRYVAECKAGRNDVRGRDFNMRWIASMVAEVHRILMRGGVVLYPRDLKDPALPDRLRLLAEANPMSFVVEQAGGLGSTGRARILDLDPGAIHQRVPVILGSRNEVERIERYHREHDSGADEQYTSPLFQERSLFAR